MEAGLSDLRKVVLISGGSRGLGRRLAEAFVRSGACVFLVARDGRRLAETEASIGAGTGRVSAFAGDLVDVATPKAAVDACLERFGRLDAVIANAAIQGPIGPFETNSTADWELTIETNLMAPVRLARAALPALRVHGDGGSVVFLSGGGATAPRVNFSAYAAAKAGLVRFAETLALELRPSGISVNCIAPGVMPTRMSQSIAEAQGAAGDIEMESVKKGMASGENAFMAPVELAMFLTSPDARGISGKLIAAQWDRWRDWPARANELAKSDVYTLRRITGRDRGKEWGDA